MGAKDMYEMLCLNAGFEKDKEPKKGDFIRANSATAEQQAVFVMKSEWDAQQKNHTDMSKLNWRPLTPGSTYGPVMHLFLIAGPMHSYGVAVETPSKLDDAMIIIIVNGCHATSTVEPDERRAHIAKCFWDAHNAHPEEYRTEAIIYAFELVAARDNFDRKLI